ncbi:MAG: hypothetical protein ACXU9O_11280 [Gemmatimonadaceae bacterium]
MRYRPLVLVSTVALSACSSILGGDDAEKRFAGFYILDSVDGTTLPAPVAPQQGCPRTVRKVATLSLSAGGPDTRPTYNWEIRVDADCQPVPAGVFQGADDLGNWNAQSAQLSFTSIVGEGAYPASVEENSGNPTTITFSYLGNSYRFRRMDDPIGVVFVKVFDQFGQPVEGVVLHFAFRYGVEGGGTIGPALEFGTSGPVGECAIMMTPPAGYEVPASQPNPFTVTVVEGAIHVQATLTKL